MSEIPFIDDAYIDEIIKSAEAYNPALNKTQGVKLRELMKKLRDRMEQNNTGIVHTTGEQNISGAKTFNQIAAEELSFLKNGYVNVLKNPSDQNQNYVYTLPKGSGELALKGNLTKTDLGLGNVDNTSDADKPVSLAAQAALNSYQLKSEKGISNGYASLDANGKIPNSQVPALAISETFVVASQSAMLAIVGADKGDVAVRTDISKSFILTAPPASALSNWQELLTPKDPIEPIKNQTSVIQDAYIRIGGVIDVENSITGNKGRLTPNTLMVNSGLNAGLIDSSAVTVVAGNATFCSLRHNSIVIGKQSGHTINILPDYSGLKNPVESIHITLPKTSGILATRSEFLSGQTIEANTSGNAATATNALRWGGVLGNLSVSAIAPHNFAVTDLRTGLWASAVPSQIKTLLGIPLDGETLETVMARNNITSPTMFLKNEAGDNILQISSGDGLNGSTTIEAKKLIGTIGNTIRLNPYYGGNVSIGVNTAIAKLDIKGGAGQNTLRLSKPSNNAPSLEFVGESTSTILEAGDDYKIYTNGVIRQSISRSGATTFTGNVFSNLAPTDGSHLTNKTYVDTKLPLSGGTLTGALIGTTANFDSIKFRSGAFDADSYGGGQYVGKIQLRNSVNGVTTGYAQISATNNLTKPILLRTPEETGILPVFSDISIGPNTSSSPGVRGEIRVFDRYLYVCIDTNSWVRSAVTTF